MLRDAPVLVLEEPTTGLDAPAARRVIKPLRRLMRGRTTIMITHDLNLAPDADRILVLDDGRLIETGTHHELLAHGARTPTSTTRRTTAGWPLQFRDCPGQVRSHSGPTLNDHDRTRCNAFDIPPTEQPHRRHRKQL
jgi:ABC-type multidrug transport system ATPase subunit